MCDQSSHFDNDLLLIILKTVLSGTDQEKDPVSKSVSTSTAILFAEQKLLPILVDQVRDAASAEKWPQFLECKRLARVEVTQQARRGIEFLDVYRKLKEAEILALVVKGCVCRAVWPKGELRVSTDEDIYVRDGDFEKTCEILRVCGLVCDERADIKKDSEIGWSNPTSTLYIELHRKLFSPDSGATGELQQFFDDAFERAQEYSIEHGSAMVWSMSPQDHLLYLILHAFKHFIRSGFGIRQVCDIGLWAKRYVDKIDHQTLMRDLEKAHALYFAAAVFAIAREDIGIETKLPECWDSLQTEREPLLRDLLNAGVYGASNRSRQHSAPMTLEAVSASRENRKKTGLLRRVFPSKKALQHKYPELADHPTRLPLIWAKRLVKYRKEIKAIENNSASECIRIAKEREELLRQYHII